MNATKKSAKKNIPKNYINGIEDRKITVQENFLNEENAISLREWALDQCPETVEHSGGTYEGIIIPSDACIANVANAIRRHLPGVNKVNPIITLMRIEDSDTKYTNWIHSDISVSKWSLVLSLCGRNSKESFGGTAVWEHKIAGPLDKDEFVRDYIGADTFDQSRWVLRSLFGLKWNTATIFPSDIFHSRYPFQHSGSTNEDSRLTLVMFFND